MPSSFLLALISAYRDKTLLVELLMEMASSASKATAFAADAVAVAGAEEAAAAFGVARSPFRDDTVLFCAFFLPFADFCWLRITKAMIPVRTKTKISNFPKATTLLTTSHVCSRNAKAPEASCCCMKAIMRT